jgi:hypothetical protein
MENKRDQQAFPTGETEDFDPREGMNLRDYFAGQVMSTCTIGFDNESIERQAEISYRMADAMMKERYKNR